MHLTGLNIQYQNKRRSELLNYQSKYLRMGCIEKDNWYWKDNKKIARTFQIICGLRISEEKTSNIHKFENKRFEIAIKTRKRISEIENKFIQNLKNINENYSGFISTKIELPRTDFENIIFQKYIYKINLIENNYFLEFPKEHIPYMLIDFKLSELFNKTAQKIRIYAELSWAYNNIFKYILSKHLDNIKKDFKIFNYLTKKLILINERNYLLNYEPNLKIHYPENYEEIMGKRLYEIKI